MAEMIILHNLVEDNGKTIRENNLERSHKYPKGTLIEVEGGARMFVYKQTRDCDGSPLYTLTWDRDFENAELNRCMAYGFGEEGMILIEQLNQER